MKTFQKSLIAAALVAGSFAAIAGTPGTTNLLFPYVTSQTGAYTFISIAQQGGSAAAAKPLHFTYATKKIAANASIFDDTNFLGALVGINTSESNCVHIDGDAKSTGNDLMQFEMSKRIDVPAAFGDTTSVPKYFPNNAAGTDRHGMLIVNNAVGASYGSGATYTGATLYGEARIIHTASGLAAGYSTDDLHTADSANPDFSSTAGPDGGNIPKVISWFAEPTVNTTFFFLPLGTEQDMAFAANSITQEYIVEGAGAGIAGHYNNNEEFQSSNAGVTVSCLGLVNRSKLMGGLNAGFSANGGWGNITNTGRFDRNNFLAYKYETTSATGGPAAFVNRVPVK